MRVTLTRYLILTAFLIVNLQPVRLLVNFLGGIGVPRMIMESGHMMGAAVIAWWRN